MSMSLVDNNTLNLSLSKKEMMIFNKISRRLNTQPDTLANRVIHDFIETTKDLDEDSIWKFIGGGDREYKYGSSKHTRGMVVSEE
jgi:hypothetical protein